jgi:ketopantoate reductase
VPSIQSFEWSKYAVFVCLMAPAVRTRLETYKSLQDWHTASITAALLHEMARIAATRGIDFEDTVFFSPRALSQLSRDGAVARLRGLGEQFASRAPAHNVSTLQDMEQDKTRLEVEETLDYAV